MLIVIIEFPLFGPPGKKVGIFLPFKQKTLQTIPEQRFKNKLDIQYLKNISKNPELIFSSEVRCGGILMDPFILSYKQQTPLKQTQTNQFPKNMEAD